MCPSSIDDPAAHAAAPAEPRVLLVMADSERRQILAQLLRSIAPGCRLVQHADEIDALLAVTHARPDLVLIDSTLGADAAALKRHVAHLMPGVAVFVFDGPGSLLGTPGAPGAPGVRSWDEAPSVCARWLEGFRARLHAPPGKPSTPSEESDP